MERENMLQWLHKHLPDATDEQLKKVFIVATQIIK